MAALGLELEGVQREALMAEALSTAQSIADQTKRAGTLVALSNVLDEAQLLEAVGVASQILFTNDRLRAVSSLAKRLSGENKKPVLEAEMNLVEELTDDHDRAEALTLLASDCIPSQNEKTFERVLGLFSSDVNH